MRRALLLFALVLGLTALATALSPSRETSSSGDPAPTPGARPLPRTLSYDADATEPNSRTVRAGEHVVLSVSSEEGGLVTIPRLGRTASVAPATAARFDLLAPAAGRYDMLLAPSGGGSEARRVGTLVTRP
jgi:hypothetical protein